MLIIETLLHLAQMHANGVELSRDTSKSITDLRFCMLESLVCAYKSLPSLYYDKQFGVLVLDGRNL